MSVRSTGDRAEQSAPQTAHYFVCAARGHFCFCVLLAFKADAQKAKFGFIFISVRDNVLMEKQAPCHCRDTDDSQFGATRRRKGEIFFSGNISLILQRKNCIVVVWFVCRCSGMCSQGKSPRERVKSCRSATPVQQYVLLK